MIKALVCVLAAIVVLALDSVAMIYAIAATVTTACALWSLLRNKSRILIFPFQLGALIFIFPDGFVVGHEAISVGGGGLVTAAKYLCASVCLLHAGYWWLPGISTKLGAQKQSYVARWAVPTCMVLVIIYTLASYQFTITSATDGRAAALDVGGLGAAGRSVLFVTSMLLPGVVLFLLLQKMDRLRALMYSLLMSSPIFVSLIFQGNRFPLLYCASIFLCVYQPKLMLPSVKVLKNALILVVLGLFISSGMVKMRDSVYGVSDPGRFSYGLIKSEGILDANASMVGYFSHEQYTYGASIGGIFLFWIPRAIWSSKPELLGYWLPRQYSRDTLSDSQSVGFGFSGNGYVDFGFFGGLLISLLLGVGLSTLDRVVARLRSKGGFDVLIASTFLPFSFFLARNLDTGIIIAVMLLAMCMSVKLLFFRRVKF